MIDVFELYEAFVGRVNSQQGGHIRPERNYIQWANQISVSLYEEKFSGWEKSKKIKDDLSNPFLVTANVNVVNGVASFPKNYGHLSSARYYKLGEKVVPKPGSQVFDSCGNSVDIKKERPSSIPQEIWDIMQEEMETPSKSNAAIEIDIDEVTNDRWGAMQRSRFSGASENNPKITQFDEGFKVLPKSISIIVLDYLKRPTPAKFSYTVVPGNPVTGDGDYIVYDKEKSVQLEWSELVINEFLTRLEMKYFKYTRDREMYQSSEEERKTTV